MKTFLVPLMLFLSSVFMSMAWIGHLKFKHLGFWTVAILAWLLVFPEYLLNASAFRWGHGTFSAAQMAAFNLSSGVLCVALVSRFFLGEPMSTQQLIGFILMILAIILIMSKPPSLQKKKPSQKTAPSAEFKPASGK